MIETYWPHKPPLGVTINRLHPTASELEGRWLFNENSGDVVHDLSGNGNHGTLMGMDFPPTVTSGWNPGEDGPALAFEDVDEYVDNSRPSNLTALPLTISARLRFTSPVAFQIYSVAGLFDSDHAEARYQLRVSPRGGASTWIAYAVHGSGGGSSTASSPELVMDYEWHDLCAVFVGTAERYIYVDGLLRASNTGGRAEVMTNCDDFLVGARNNGGFSEYCKGLIDDVILYRRVLTAREVSDLHVNRFAAFVWQMPLVVAAAVAGNPWYAYAQQ